MSGRLTDAFVVHTSEKEAFLTNQQKQVSRERPGTAQKKQSLQEQIAAYVEAHLTEKVTLKVIAEHCGVSVSTVTQLFQKKLNSTFHEFMTQRRLEEACRLIMDGIPLEQVGKKIGYRDHSTFYRAFRQQFGVSPREYRSIQLLSCETE